MSVDYKLIGSRLKQARKARGLTQEQLAELLDVSVGYVSQIERGITKANLEMLCAVCDQINCELGALLTGCSTARTDYLSDELYDKCKALTEKQKQKAMKIIDLLLEND